MATYRCFFLDRNDRMLDVDVAEQADDDAAAVWGARLLARGGGFNAVEIWDRDRLVHRCERTRAGDPAGPRSGDRARTGP